MTCHSSTRIENEWAKERMKVPTCRTRERSRKTALWTGTDQDGTAVRISTCGELENVDSPEGMMWQERNLQVSEEANIFDNENIPLSIRQFQKSPAKAARWSIEQLECDGRGPPRHQQCSKRLRATQSEVCNERFGTGQWQWVVKVSDSLVWRRSRRFGKPAEACGTVQHDCVSRPDQDETLEGTPLER